MTGRFVRRRDDLTVYRADGQGTGLGKLHEDMLVPGEGIAFAVRLGFEVGAGFAEIEGVFGGHGNYLFSKVSKREQNGG
ncbi:MAG: hypothetical protein ACLSF2_05290 [Butyricicoccus sp.]